MLARNAADITAIDAQSWRLIQRFDPDAAQLCELDRTPPTPAPPYITGPAHDPETLRRALADGRAALPTETRQRLGLRAIVPLPEAAYLAVPRPRRIAQTA